MTTRRRAELERRLLVEGLTPKVVAAAFGLTVKTVNQRVTRFQHEGAEGLAAAGCASRRPEAIVERLSRCAASVGLAS